MSRRLLPRARGHHLATALGVAFLLGAALLLARAAGAAGCPNEAFRTGPSAALPGCRAYEMVSPLEKGGANVSNLFAARPSPSGDTVTFYSTASFAGSPSSPLINAYIGRRGANWTTDAIDPPMKTRSGCSSTPAPRARPTRKRRCRRAPSR